MIDTRVTTYPEWNGWFDDQGTFIPYTDSGISGGVYFKGFYNSAVEGDYPDNPSVGDAYRMSGYYSGYFAYDGGDWVTFSPAPPTPVHDYLMAGYYQDCNDDWTQYTYPETSGPCGEFTVGDTMNFYEGEGGYNPLGQYEFDGVGWFND